MKNPPTAIRTSRIDTGGNTGAVLLRVSIDYGAAASADEGETRCACTCPTTHPRTLVCKLMNAAQGRSQTHRDKLIERLIMTSLGYTDERMMALETDMYARASAIFMEPAGVRVPRCYYAAMEGTSNALTRAMFVMWMRKEHVRGAILMEDLGGGETWGAVQTVPTPVAEMVLLHAARIHGYTANLIRERRVDPATLPRTFNYFMSTLCKGPALIHKLQVMNSSLAAEVDRRWGDSDLRVLRDEPDVMQALKACCRLYRRRVYPRLSGRHRFVCCLHGDLHAGNFMLMPDKSVRAFDWQMWGIGPVSWELAYFFSSNVDADPVEDERLLRLYHAELEKHAPGMYPFALLKRDLDVATVDYLTSGLVRRGAHETPASVARANSKDGGYTAGIQSVCTPREVRLLRRLRDIWKRDPSFRFNSKQQ